MTSASNRRPNAEGEEPTPYSTRQDRAALGRRARSTLSRTRHGQWSPAPDRPDPLELLARQEQDRVPDLVPIRHGRMAGSPFAFFRGAATVMAWDLGAEPRTGLSVQLCGDAHLVNFGGFASPERDLVFDVNDFDETLRGPFEWDVKRLSASLEVAGRDREFDEVARTDIVSSGVRAYREAVREFAAMRLLDLWYAKLDMAEIERRWGAEAGGQEVKSVQRLAARAESKNHLKAFNRLVRVENGQLQFVSDPPLLVPIADLLTQPQARALEATIDGALHRYRSSLARDRQQLLDRYSLVQVARKVVGVGSVGTRCWVALFVGTDESDPLFIQVKEAEASVLEDHVGKSPFANHAQRVVEGQRSMQAASDILLGWARSTDADGQERDYYMRQLWDWKVSAPVEKMTPSMLRVYAQICGWTLARAHARSGDPAAIGGYLGSGPIFDQAMASFGRAYADQNAADHQALVDAIAAGRMEAVSGV